MMDQAQWVIVSSLVVACLNLWDRQENINESRHSVKTALILFY